MIVSGAHPERGCFKRFSDERMDEVARAAMPGVPIQDMEWLNYYDAYYYNQNGSRVLPVLRVRFNDPQRTWLYLNLQHGQMISSMTIFESPFQFRTGHLWPKG